MLGIFTRILRISSDTARRRVSSDIARRHVSSDIARRRVSNARLRHVKRSYIIVHEQYLLSGPSPKIKSRVFIR
jgi:hypothetical protein